MFIRDLLSTSPRALHLCLLALLGAAACDDGPNDEPSSSFDAAVMGSTGLDAAAGERDGSAIPQATEDAGAAVSDAAALPDAAESALDARSEVPHEPDAFVADDAAPADAFVASDADLDDGGAGRADASVNAPDSGADASLPPMTDGGGSVPGLPVGRIYTEVKKSFVLVQPAGLAGAYGLLVQDTGNVRLFLNSVEATDAGMQVRYGSVFLQPAGPVFQYPNSVGVFRVTRSQADAHTLVSDPFNYHLHAWVPSSPGSDTGYGLELQATQTVWKARFDSAYERIDEGSIDGVVLRTEAVKVPLKLDALSCLAACKTFTFCSRGVNTLADLLDCNSAKTDVDTNGDGKTDDGYRLRIAFKSERIF